MGTDTPPTTGQSGPPRTLEPPPAELVLDGRYRFGTYAGPIARINPLDIVTASGTRGRLRRAARNARLKEWEAFQLCDDSVFVLGAVYDTKSISLLQVLVVDKHAATIRRWEKRGRVEGFNLTDNQVRDPQRYNENAVWLGDRVVRLPAVHVERPSGPWGTWLVRDADGSGQVNVRFTPTVRSEMHVGPRRSLAEYYAPYGWYEGRIHTDDVELSVDGMFGVGEQKLILV